MMAMGWLEIVLILASGGPLGNELLDYVDSQAYWKIKGVSVSEETIAAELSRPQQGTSSQQAWRVRRLMAIRTLGELKSKKALPALRALLKSKEFFVADYAARAIAAIEGKKHVRPGAPAIAKERDLGLMPPGCGLVGQIALTPGAAGAIDLSKALGATTLPGGMSKERALRMVTKMVLEAAEKVGNIRLEMATVGVATDAGEDAGFAVVVVRGLYDAAATRDLLRPMVKETSTVDGLEVLRPEREFALLLPSNDRLVLLAGPREEAIPLAAVISAINVKKTGLQATPEMRRLAAAVPANSALWAVAEISDAYREAEILAPFDTAVLTGTQSNGSMALKLTADGKDAQAVAQAVAILEAGRTEAIEEMETQTERMGAMGEALKPIIEFMKSIRTETKGGRVTVTASLEAGPAQLAMPMLGWVTHSPRVSHEETTEQEAGPGPGPDDF